MEKSLFCVCAQCENGEYALLNTRTSQFTLLNEEEGRAFCEESYGGAYAQKLVEQGFLVEDATAELAVLKKQFEETKRNRDELTLCIVPTYQCNFACPYCYEPSQKPEGKMTLEVQQAIMRFIDQIHDRDGFSRLKIQWYGGEPLLAMAEIEELSFRTMGLCEEINVEYSAEIVTNASLVTPAVARRLKACGVESAMPTLDGQPGRHNVRRPCRAGEDSQAMVLEGVRNLRAAGIAVNLMLNLDKNNLADYRELYRQFDENSDLREKKGFAPLTFTATLLKDYGHCFNCESEKGFCSPEFDLMPRSEFAQVQRDLFLEQNAGAGLYSALTSALAPAQLFCHAQLGNYFLIDSIGDVYKCDGWMGDRSYALFNLLGSYDIFDMANSCAAFHGELGAACSGLDRLPAGNDAEFNLGALDAPGCCNVDEFGTPAYNPCDDPLCKTCVVLPLCMGECEWDRTVVRDSCHVLRDTVADYVRELGEICRTL